MSNHRTTRGRYRRSAAIGLAIVAASAVAGCDMVKVGTRCSAGAAPARNATHLVLCQNGKWTQSLTIQETANLLLALQPAKAEVVSGNEQSAQVGSFFAKDFQIKVTRGDGKPSANTKVELIAPTTGASLDRGPRSLTTDDNGVAAFLATPNTVAGTYEVTAKVNDKVTTKLTFTNTPASAKNVSLWSGANQTATAFTDFGSPIVLKVTDTYGNPVPNVVPVLTSTNVGLSGQPGTGTFTTPAATASTGLTSFTVKAPQTAGDANFKAVVSEELASSGVSFALKVKPGAVDEVIEAGTPQSAAASAAFASPLQVTVEDVYNNKIPDVTVTYTVPPSGASAVLSSPTAVTNAQGVASVTATANATQGGPYNVVVSIAGYTPSSPDQFALTNT